ncbi:hypothetical protein [Roseateles violae]|uniref:Uncharacterized protein n=1 Tax=Roseateles violae TaxID=3058042 RepID=A0ABT8DPV7_9BURK|nr:hypothetical protein [Pelomonas sp. PFR6]MDN3920046.1 hypothetical protein [Pelomonas sp. PFR6]
MAAVIGTLMVASSAPAQSTSASLPPASGASNTAASEKQREWASAIVAQARDVMRTHLRDGRTRGFPLPATPLGPAKGNNLFPYGWMVHDRGGKYASLYDISESTVQQFNLVFHGRAVVMPFGGALGAGGLPYAGYAPDSKHWIVVPFAYLQANESPVAGVSGQVAVKAPVAAAATTSSAATTAGSGGGAVPELVSASERGRIAVGLPLDPAELERRGVYWTDSWLGMAVLYATTDMTKVHGAMDNLIDDFLRNENHGNSPAKIELQRLREKCAHTSETFAKQDCLRNLNRAFSTFGRAVIESRQLHVFVEAMTSWDERDRRVVSKVMGSLPDSGCDPGSVCMRVGPYGAGWNVVCYRLDKPLPQQLSFSMPEDEARALSRRAGDIRDLRHVSFALEVTSPVSALPSPRMCTRPIDKVVAEGRARVRSEVMWNSAQAHLVRESNSAPAAVTAGAAAATTTRSGAGEVRPLSAVAVPSTAPAPRIKIDAK